MMTLNSLTIDHLRLTIENLYQAFQSSAVNLKSSIHSTGARQHFFHTPSLASTQRTRFHNAHSIPDLAGSVFIMRKKFRGFPLNLFIERVLHQSVHGNRDSFLHGRAGNGADLAFADSSFNIGSHVSSIAIND
jgi:hypothetical protein